MSLLFPNHVALLKNVFRYSAKPDLKYIRQDFTRKLKKLKPHLIHFHRFIQKPEVRDIYLNEAHYGKDVSEYGSCIKLICDMFHVKAVWVADLGAPLTPIGTVRLVGNPINLDLAARFITMVCFTIEECTKRESIRYQKRLKAIRRKARGNDKFKAWSEENLFVDTRVFSRKLKLQLIYNINLYLINLLDVAPIDAGADRSYKYIETKFKLALKKKPGNPNWNLKKLAESAFPNVESPLLTPNMNLKFRNHTILN